MPNWCNNDITLTHKDPKMIDRAQKAFAEGNFLQEFIPCPKELKETVAGHCGDEYEQELNQFKMQLNKKYFGHADWYDWQVNNWGTKWDVGGDDGLIQKLNKKTLQVSFDSAWAPPCAAYEKLIEQGFYIKAFYYEPGMGFCGVWEGDKENGFMDDYHRYSDETSKTVREAIGPELDDHFGIADDMAMWEEENEE